MKAERYGAVGADQIRDGIGQRELGKIEAMPRQKRIALVDQIEDRTDDQRHPKRTAWNTFGKSVSPEELRAPDSQRLRRL